MQINQSKSLNKGINQLILPFFSGTSSKKISEMLPKALQKEATTILSNSGLIKEKAAKQLIFTLTHGKTIYNCTAVNLGKKQETNTNSVQKAGGKAVKNHTNKKQLSIVVPENHEHFRHFILGILKRSYQFSLKTKKTTKLNKIQIIADKLYDKADITELNSINKGQQLARDLVNTPPNQMYPAILSQHAKKIAKSAGRHMSCTILGEKKLAKLGCNLLLAVGRGSAKESQMIILEYKHPKAKKQKPLLVAGKGITFDAGGLNIKPTGYMETMKMDMGGAANVLGLFQIIAELKPEQHIIGVIGSAENLTGDKAMKPGDIYKAYNGKTVEITNTDAEGRLALADSIAYCEKKYKPRAIIDLATLTGACIVALGNEMTGLVSNNQEFANLVLKQSKNTGEDFWQLPLTDYFRDKVKGHASDYYNWTANVSAGCSMAAAFLEKFINKTPWCHFDIAGSSWTDNEVPLSIKGSTGAPLHTLWQTVKANPLN